MLIKRLFTVIINGVDQGFSVSYFFLWEQFGPSQ